MFQRVGYFSIFLSRPVRSCGRECPTHRPSRRWTSPGTSLLLAGRECPSLRSGCCGSTRSSSPNAPGAMHCPGCSTVPSCGSLQWRCGSCPDRSAHPPATLPDTPPSGCTSVLHTPVAGYSWIRPHSWTRWSSKVSPGPPWILPSGLPSTLVLICDCPRRTYCCCPCSGASHWSVVDCPCHCLQSIGLFSVCFWQVVRIGLTWHCFCGRCRCCWGTCWRCGGITPGTSCFYSVFPANARPNCWCPLEPSLPTSGITSLHADASLPDSSVRISIGGSFPRLVNGLSVRNDSIPSSVLT